MSIKIKIVLAVFIPLVALGFFIISGTTERLAISVELGRLQAMSQLVVKIGNLIHETQKERGRSGVFMGSKGQKFGLEMQEQRRLTDTVEGDFSKFLNSFDSTVLASDFQSALTKAVGKLNQLGEHRKKVDALAISTQDGIDFYTELDALMIDAVRMISKMTPRGEVARLVSAYVNFMEAKEKAGIERATMSGVFAEDHFPSLEIFHRFSGAVHAQKTLLYVFRSYANSEQINFYNQKMSNPVVVEVERMRDIVFDRFAEKSLGQVDAGYWFDSMTSKINLMKEVENKLADDLNSSSIAIGETARKELWQYLFGAILILIISTSLVWYTFVSISHPLLELQKKAENIMRGDYSRKSGIYANDELGQFHKAFDLMVVNVQEAKSGLEQRVKEQTAELIELKTGLEKTVDIKTFEFQKKLGELEEFKNLTIGRELKMIELKKEIEKLKRSAKI